MAIQTIGQRYHPIKIHLELVECTVIGMTMHGYAIRTLRGGTLKQQHHTTRARQIADTSAQAATP